MLRFRVLGPISGFRGLGFKSRGVGLERRQYVNLTCQGLGVYGRCLSYAKESK